MSVVDPQKEPLAGLTVTGFGNGFTVIVSVFEVAGEPVEHGDAFDVRIQVTTSPLFNVDVAKVVELVPAFTPLTCH